jgi:type VI protein secretion system component VasK
MAQNFGLDPVAHLESTVEKLMEDPITHCEALLRGLGPAELNGKGKGLCAQLSPVLATFPFNGRSKAQATPSDVNSAFKPKEGALWSFYDQNLSKYLLRQGQHYVPDSSAPIQLNQAFVGFFNRAAAFSDLAYPGGSADPHFSYNLKPIFSEGIQSLKLTIDGQAADFTPASPAKGFNWQASGAHGVQLSGKYTNGQDFQYATYDGLWAVFEWVGDVDAQQGSVLEWRLKAGKGDRAVLSPVTNQPTTVKFSIDNPVFQKGYFAGLSCVSEIAKP